MSLSLNGPGEGLALDRVPADSQGLSGEAALPGGLKADEVFGLDEGLEFQPAIEGTEASRSAQTFDDLLSYQVPEDRYALLVEVAANIASNGEVRFSIPGNDTFTLTGSVDVNLPFGDAVMLPGSSVELHHQSTDGASATQRATIIAREV